MFLKSFAAIGAALAFAGCASMSKTPATPPDQAMSHHGPHIVTVKSNVDFATTLAALQNAVDKRGFKTFAVIDHAGGAASIGATLRPTTLVIFGNPKGGAALMQAEQRMGLALPLKMLVAEDQSGATQIIYPDMAHVFHEYGIADMTGPLEKIDGALGAIANEAGAE